MPDGSQNMPGLDMSSIILSAVHMSRLMQDTPYLDEGYADLDACDEHEGDQDDEDVEGDEFDVRAAHKLAENSIRERQTQRLYDAEIEGIRKRARAGFFNASMLCQRPDEYHERVKRLLRKRGFEVEDVEKDDGTYLYTLISW